MLHFHAMLYIFLPILPYQNERKEKAVQKNENSQDNFSAHRDNKLQFIFISRILTAQFFQMHFFSFLDYKLS